MNLDELQSVQSRERQASSLQHLRASFYEEAGKYIGELRAERDQQAAASDNPFDDEEVERLTDEIRTAEQTVESIYERRVGKVVKLASIAAAGMPCDEGGLTTEEERLFETLVDRIERNRERVLSVLDGESPPLDCAPADEADEAGGADGADATSPATDTGHPVGADDPSTARSGTAGRVEAEQSREPDRVGSGATPEHDAVPDRDPGTDPGAGPDTAPSEDGTRPAPPDDPPREDAEPTATGSGTESADSSEPTTGESFDIGSAMGGAGAEGTGQTRREERGEPVPAGGSGNGGPERGEAPVGAEASSGVPGPGPSGPEADSIDRTTVRVTADVGDIYGIDGRSYDLSAEDVVTLPTPNAENLVSRNAAERLE